MCRSPSRSSVSERLWSLLRLISFEKSELMNPMKKKKLWLLSVTKKSDTVQTEVDLRNMHLIKDHIRQRSGSD